MENFVTILDVSSKQKLQTLDFMAVLPTFFDWISFHGTEHVSHKQLI